MSLDSGQGRIQRAERDLHREWLRAAALWHDDNSRVFEEEWLRPMLARVRTAERALAHMDQLLTSARRECE